MCRCFSCPQPNKKDDGVNRENRPLLEVYSQALMCHKCSVSTVAEIQDAIEKLSRKDKTALAAWLESQETPFMSPEEEALLLSRLDQAGAELDAGKGIPSEQVRRMVTKWATK